MSLICIIYSQAGQVVKRLRSPEMEVRRVTLLLARAETYVLLFRELACAVRKFHRIMEHNAAYKPHTQQCGDQLLSGL